MKKHIIPRVIALATLSFVAALATESSEADPLKVYQWTTPDGQQHMGDDMPADAAKYGYFVKDMSTGQMTFVPPPKTKQELASEARQAQQAQMAKQAKDQQTNEDNAFLVRYPTMSAIDASEKQDIDLIDAQIRREKAAEDTLENSDRDPGDKDLTRGMLVNEITRLYVKKSDRQALAEAQRKQLSDILKRRAAQ